MNLIMTQENLRDSDHQWPKRISFNELTDNLDSICNEVAGNGTSVIVDRDDLQESLVIAPLGEFNSLQQTVHLLSSPGNAARLFTALERARGKMVKPCSPEQLFSELRMELGVSDN